MYIKLIFPLFFIFSISFSSNVEAKVESINPFSFSKTESVEKIFFKAVDVNRNIKQNKKKRRKLFSKWNKTNRKRLGLGAGVLGFLGLLGWRRKLKKRRKKSKRRGLNGFGEGGCLQIFLALLAISVLALLGQWVLESLFGLMVGFWLGALLGALVMGAVVGLIWLIVKGIKG